MIDKVITFQTTGPNVRRLNLIVDGKEVRSVPMTHAQAKRAGKLLEALGWYWSSWMDMRPIRFGSPLRCPLCEKNYEIKEMLFGANPVKTAWPSCRCRDLALPGARR